MGEEGSASRGSAADAPIDRRQHQAHYNTLLIRIRILLLLLLLLLLLYCCIVVDVVVVVEFKLFSYLVILTPICHL